MRPQKSFLHRILGILVCQNDRARHCIRPTLMQSNQPGKTPIVASPGKADELSFLIRNTDGRVGLLAVQTRFPLALVVSYRSLIAGVARVEARQRDS